MSGGDDMDTATIELMHEQVRTIYRVATGSELQESEDLAHDAPAPESAEIERRFAELEALVRQNPTLGDRVPPFAFTPLVDVIEDGRDLLVEVAAPGVELDDVELEAKSDELTIHGLRRGERIGSAKTFLHAEIPRGPFSRVLRLPCKVVPSPHVDVRAGVILIRLPKL
jgi:HSP20 family molecular chaperone IbpA